MTVKKDIGPVDIGRLNESPLHRSLKALYCVPGARQEVVLDGFVADVVHPDAVIYEIQTGSFGRLRRKLPALLDRHRIVLVHPVATVRWLYRLTGDPDVPPRPRRSPRRGQVADVLVELVSIPEFLDHPNFELEVVLVEVEEFRHPVRTRRGDGWAVAERRLRSVADTVRLRSSADLLGLLHSIPVAPFDTADLAAALGSSRALARKLAFCLRRCARIEPCGKRGNAVLYRYLPPA